MSTGEVNDKEIIAYKKHFFAMDPFIGIPSGTVVSLDEFIPESERENSEYFQQFLKPINVFNIIGTDVITKEGAWCSLRVGRGKEARPFCQSDRDLISQLIPHINRAIRLHMRLNRVETERNLYAGAVNQLSVGTIILDEEGKVLQTNQVAEELIGENDGIKVVSKSLQVGTSSDTRKMRDLIKQAIAAQNGDGPSIVEAMRIQRPSGLSDLGIVIRSVPPAEWSEGKQCPSVVIFISDPEKKSRAPQEIVKTLFDLTPAEAQLAMLLANGLTVDETSEELCISRNTARAHLRSIFSKTGVTRQTMLVRLILRSVATLG